MATINLNQRNGTGSGDERPVLPTDIYRMKIIEAKLEDDTFAKPDRDGVLPQKIAITWEMSILTEEQQEAADEAGEDWSTVRVWTRFNPYYGTVKAGGPSKFKAFLDSLQAQGLLPDFDVEAFDVESLVDIEQRVSVERYIKTMGVNAGQPGNKAIAFAPVKAKKPALKIPINIPQPVEDDTF